MHIKCHSMVFVAVAATAMAAFGDVTTKSITSDITITLDTAVTGIDRAANTSSSNPNHGGGGGYNLDCSDGATITLEPASTPGLNRFFSTIKGDAGTVTLDLSRLNGAPFLMLGNLHFGASATLHIKGTNTVCFGSDLSWPSYYPTFNVPHAVEFDEGVDGKIVFQDQCCLYALPAGMTYEIASGANVAVHNNALGVSGDYTMTDFDISIFDSTGGDGTGSTTSFPANTTITVPTGRTLNIFPCKVNAELRWDRKGGIIANNINLAGGAIAIHVNQWPVNINGALRGTGTIKRGWTFGNWTSANQTTVAGPVALTNAVVDLLGRNSNSSQGMNLGLSKLLPGSSFASISLHKTATSVAEETSYLGLGMDNSADYTGKPIVIASLVGGRLANGTVNSLVPLSITSASGGMKVNNRAGAVFGAIDPAADVSVLQLGSATLPAGWGSYWESDGYAHLFLLKDGGTFDAGAKSPVAGADIVATNAISVTGANSMFRITAAQGGDVTLYQSSGTRMQVVADGGRINLRRAFADWRAIPSLWLDASAPNTVSNLYIREGTIEQTRSANVLAAQYVYYTNNFPLVNQWFDCREDMRVYKAWSDRYDQPYNIGGINYSALFPHTHPYRVIGGLNGKDYISFGKYGDQLAVSVQTAGGETISSSANTTCRAYIYDNDATTANGRPGHSQKPKYAFLVFGSQQGGGYGLLGANNTNYLERTSTSLNAALAPNASINIWVDGISVSPTQTGVLNGGWQVITLGLAGKVQIGALGMGMYGTGSKGNGGQNYAEIIFVDEDLTDMQRQTIEIALAEKWGLAGQYNYPAWATEAVSAVYGSSGTVSLDTDARLTGAFSGTIELNGHGLEIAGDALPPGDSAISTANMVGWYDPDAPGMTKEADNCKFNATRKADNVQVSFDKDPALRMTHLWNRLNASYNLNDYLLYSLGDRAPYLNTTLRGVGPMRKWMDFANLTSTLSYTEYKEINNGNVLRFSRIKNASTGQGDGTSQTQPMRTIMMVQDSVRGGGQPFADGVNVISPVLYSSRTASSATASPGMPIYPSGSDKILTAGKTYLDGEEVDGTVLSFRGRPEVLTVIPTNTFGVIAIGQLGNSQARSIADGNTTAEIIGEIMMWNCALDDASRKTAEAYLSWKWLGTTTEGYSALTNATVTGAGAVKAANASVLPKFAAGCTADVVLDNGDMAFTLDGDVLSGAFDFGGATLNLPASCAITVALPRKPVLGDYVLVSCGGIAEGTSFTFATTGYGAAKAKFEVSEGRIVLHVVPRGIMINFK